MEHKDQHKVSLSNLEKENEELKRALVNIKRERDYVELSNNAKGKRSNNFNGYNFICDESV